MAYTRFGVNDALAVKLWSKGLDAEALKATPIAPLIGDGTNSIIQRKTETGKGSGDKVTYGLRLQLTGDGFTENEVAEGNGESLSIYSDGLLINELGHVVSAASNNTIDAQRVPFEIRSECKDGLADWFAKRMSVSFFNQVCGFTAETRTKYAGLNAIAAPSSGRVLRPTGSNDQALGSSNLFTLDLIDKAKEMAETASPKIRPVKVGSDDYYVCYLHPYQVTDLRTTTATGQWLDIQKAAMAGGMVDKSPIFTGALGVYNGVVLRSAVDVTQGVNSSTSAAISTVRRAVFLGAQAAVIGFGQDNGPTRYRWNEELFDHKRRMEVSAWTIFGLKKTQFNNVDFGTIVISTYAAAHG
ncbi:hypothetical protein AZC_0843 [Azorhizobium caulinodans ORS 571]|uniref:N4-gp56 family major capsid protein n=1 Tax=Azorhizobium caulinodans (strain ATCC 43989 / DSM 5975 / JCM 20966 / LMG 6465 / NBRC 14845 / NCIMB 13405 / ORS 571) TaxID=438753 RepID=A8HTJ5_AZOC5|nr:N4-gp56 family major capsid protein [Azorhizobium caulinodans]BAF86841.1 hypothetical protein AZC_0843 [Azorhizobium caulinodans ORS 571]